MTHAKTRIRGLTVTTEGENGPVVHARPVSLHGAAVFCKRFRGHLGRLTVRVAGAPITDDHRELLEEAWRAYLP